MIEVDIAYKVEGDIGIRPEIDSELDVLALWHNGNRSSSGSGFGQRDLQYEFSTRADASAFRKEASNLPVRFTNISIEDLADLDDGGLE